MGHGGQHCPFSEDAQVWEDMPLDEEVWSVPIDTFSGSTTMTTITTVHSTGVFAHNAVWCGYPGSHCQQHLQLLKAGLFPASTT